MAIDQVTSVAQGSLPARSVGFNGSLGWRSFRPLPLLSNPHVQTILGRFWPQRRETFPSVHSLVELPDGDALAVVVSTPAHWRSGDRTVVMVHGLCGCYGSPYMSRIAGKLLGRGLRVVRVNLRGCGSGVGLARRPYHSGQSEDIRCVLRWLAARGPESPVTLIGFSLGGNIVLKMAGEDGPAPTAGVERVAAVSAPIDLEACSRMIERPSNHIYETYFVRQLVAQVRELEQFFPELPVATFPPRLRLRAFDDLFTAPRSGFRDAADYYSQSSAAPRLASIGVPTLLVSSRDDPFITAAPYDALPRNPHIEVCLTEHGGHLGFLGRTGRALDPRWMDNMLMHWVEAR
jgi:predicted alpha/beta-fold hydrolase